MAREHDRAKAAFARALVRFREIPRLLHGRVQPLTSMEASELIELAQVAAVETLVWARAFDERSPDEAGRIAFSAQ